MNTVVQHSGKNSVIFIWMIRSVFALSFILEANILIRRDKLVQKVLLKTLKNLFMCNKRSEKAINSAAFSKSTEAGRLTLFVSPESKGKVSLPIPKVRESTLHLRRAPNWRKRLGNATI